MYYSTKNEKLEDNLNLTRLRTAELTEAVNNALMQMWEVKREGFTLNDLIPLFAEGVQTTAEGFYTGFLIGRHIAQSQAAQPEAEAAEPQEMAVVPTPQDAE